MLNNKNISFFLSTIFSLVLIVGINTSAAQDGTVVDVISTSEDHTILAQMLEETELNNVISEQGPFTVVAPTDEAFEALGSELDEIQSSPERMQNLVIGHLFQGEVPAADAEPVLEIEIEEGDIPASNGLVHVVDEVIQNQN
ncbi:MAG: fasciclin domain-containing protein [Balneolaceae bacterium]